jgi:hypothetical protein
MVSDFIESMGMDGSVKLLMNEVNALKCMQLYQITGNAFRREYFEKMRREFQGLLLPTQSQILSLSEKREFQFVQHHGYTPYNLFLQLRKIYGISRGYLKRPSLITTSAKVPSRIGQGP